MRERSGTSRLGAAELIGADRARISHIEAGRLGVSEERIRRFAVFYSCDDDAYVEALCAMSREHRGQFWWDEYRGILAPDFLDIAELEHHSRYLRSIQALTIPGLLQTEEYARALFEGAVPSLPEEQMDARTEHRMRRRQIFERTSPPHFEALIHEAALRMTFGGRDVARKQLEHLLVQAERPWMTIRVIPFRNERFVEIIQPIVYSGGIVAGLDTVRVDGPFGAYFLDSVADIERYRKLFCAAVKASLGVSESLELVRSVIREV